MSLSPILKLSALLLVTALAVALYLAWQDFRRQQSLLQADLKSTEQYLATATQRQATREADLNKLIATLQKKKATVTTPAQILRDLPQELPLPKPITTDLSGSGASIIPKADLRPLYDFALDCRECQARLSTTQSNLKDEQAKTQALSRERDTALQAAKGGSVWKRLTRAAKWFALGAAAGAIAARATH